MMAVMIDPTTLPDRGDDHKPLVSGRWHAEVTFLGTLTDDQMLALFDPQTGPAKSASSGDGRVRLRFVLERCPTYSLAYQELGRCLNSDRLWPLVESKVLTGPVALELMDERRRDEQINVQLGLPADTPPDETTRILLDQIAKLPPATDEDRARWGADRG